MKLPASLLLLLLLCQTAIALSEYKVVKATKESSNITLELEYFGKDEFYGKPSSPIIKKLKFVFQGLMYNQFYFKITDLEGKRFETLRGDAFPVDTYENFTYPLRILDAELRYTENPFDFEIIQLKNEVVLFSTYDHPFIFSNYYIEFTTKLHNDLLYGLGERFSSNLRKTNGKWTVYNKANDQEIDKGTGVSSYGYYPYYVLADNFNNGHLAHLKSTHPMDVIKFEKGGNHYLTFKIIGGIINFRYVLEKNLNEAIWRYLTGYVEKVAIPPFWAMGFHQSKWGYDSAAKLQEVIANYKRTGLPLDTIWSDIDYMIEFRDFTVD